MISGWIRDLSDRDIKAAQCEGLSPEATVSRSTVSRICETIEEQSAAWRTRDPSQVELSMTLRNGAPWTGTRAVQLLHQR